FEAPSKERFCLLRGSISNFREVGSPRGTGFVSRMERHNASMAPNPCNSATGAVDARLSLLAVCICRGNFSLLPPRPGYALVAGDHAADALEYELLQAFSFPGFGRVEVTLGIGRDIVQPIELAGLASAVAE